MLLALLYYHQFLKPYWHSRNNKIHLLQIFEIYRVIDRDGEKLFWAKDEKEKKKCTIAFWVLLVLEIPISILFFNPGPFVLYLLSVLFFAMPLSRNLRDKTDFVIDVYTELLDEKRINIPALNAMCDDDDPVYKKDEIFKLFLQHFSETYIRRKYLREKEREKEQKEELEAVRAESVALHKMSDERKIVVVTDCITVMYHTIKNLDSYKSLTEKELLFAVGLCYIEYFVNKSPAEYVAETVNDLYNEFPNVSANDHENLILFIKLLLPDIFLNAENLPDDEDIVNLYFEKKTRFVSSQITLIRTWVCNTIASLESQELDAVQEDTSHLQKQHQAVKHFTMVNTTRAFFQEIVQEYKSYID